MRIENGQPSIMRLTFGAKSSVHSKGNKVNVVASGSAVDTSTNYKMVIVEFLIVVFTSGRTVANNNNAKGNFSSPTAVYHQMTLSDI